MRTRENNIKYFLYARKSSESEDRQVQSIKDQVNRLKDLAKDLDLGVVKEFTESKSAKQPNNRPIFDEMLKKIERGEADGILCWQINRLSRNPVDSGKINWMLQQGIIKSIQTVDKEYLPDDNVLMFSVESGMANQFILDLKKNTIRGLKGKIERGWLPGKAPQGYINDVINKTIIKDDERFDVLRRMWDEMLTGNYTVPKLLDKLNDEWGYLTRKTKRGGGRPMSRSEIYRILNDPFYYGYFKYKDKIHKGNHEPMITLGEFERVQEILGATKKPKQKTRTFSFTGIIRCGTCGCSITAEEKSKIIKSSGKRATYVYYRCTRRKTDIKCQEPAVNLETMEKQIIREIEKYTIPEEFKDWALGVLSGYNDKEIEMRQKSYELLEAKYSDLQKQLDNLTKLRLKDLLSDEEFIRERTDLQNEIIRTREKLDQNQDRGQNWVDLVEKAFNFATYAKEKFETTLDLGVKREILATMGQTFVLSNKKLQIEPIEWLVPISNLNKNLKKEIKRLEPTKNRQSSVKMPALCGKNPQWGGYWELNPD